MVKRIVETWGRLWREPHDWIPLSDRDGAVAELQRAGGALGLAYGSGLSYGDVALNPGGRLWGTRTLDRFISFDRGVGAVECEPGVTLQELTRHVLPHGWFLPVTPGTQLVTVGGAIANDIHGKNHHRYGCFGDNVDQILLVRTDGRQIVCGPGRDEPWFRATVGGLGLTGLITRVSLRLRPVPGPWIESEVLPFDTLADFVRLSDDSAAGWEYTVAWIDCLATRGQQLRGVLFRGNHVQDDRPPPVDRQWTWPFTPRWSLINGLTLRAFNAAFWARQCLRAGRSTREPYFRFFYPLDGLLQWNRIYGSRGFYQYQCVLPEAVQLEAAAELLSLIARSGTGSFLAVLKTFGQRKTAGLLSFPMPGITLALDFPNRGADTLRLFERMNAVVDAAGGRLYPAKDACMPRELFERSYPALAEFKCFRDAGLSSRMSRRLMGS